MAVDKCKSQVQSGRLYRGGKLVEPSLPETSKLQPADVWNWLPKGVRVDLLEQCFERVKRHSTPPSGEPFVMDGVPYSDPAQFAENLAEEFRERLFQMVAARGEGPYYVLPEVSQ